ncbi:hypothetical protein FOMPIDRAFT_1135701 [Fomitopsis schrenkii]|uniref:Uncharacterized protein n=1 Tax=Fomitopsis schrenkii TaxID=2126942 RepID=S8EVK0_FOMSC|nr:hypothetical protein FOMPIDRAFT_1135701 [Fomitopsis schrenkii]
MVHFGRNDPRNAIVSAQGEGGDSTINSILATLYTAQQTPKDAPLRLGVTTNTLQRMLGERLTIWETRGWIGVKWAPQLRALASTLRQRCATTTFEILTQPQDLGEVREIHKQVGHASTDTLPQKEDLDLRLDPRFNLSGAKLSSLTQALAYTGIRALTKRNKRRTTEKNLTEVRDYLKTLGRTQSNAEIWKGLYHKDVRRQISDFLWKALHGALRIGKYWDNIPRFEDRAECPTCGVKETMDHIIRDCNAMGKEVLWTEARRLWEATGHPWQAQDSNSVMTLTKLTWSDDWKTVKPGAARLWRILISETTYMIWKLRCERVVGHPDEQGWEHNREQVTARWRRSIEDRLKQDIESTRKKYGRQATRKEVVLSTWTPVLHDIGALPFDWTRLPGFLVGRASPVRIAFDR